MPQRLPSGTPQGSCWQVSTGPDRVVLVPALPPLLTPALAHAHLGLHSCTSDSQRLLWEALARVSLPRGQFLEASDTPPQTPSCWGPFPPPCRPEAHIPEAGAWPDPVGARLQALGNPTHSRGSMPRPPCRRQPDVAGDTAPWLTSGSSSPAGHLLILKLILWLLPRPCWDPRGSVAMC